MNHKGAVEGDRPTDKQQSNKNAVGALDQNGLPKDKVKIAEDAIGANADKRRAKAQLREIRGFPIFCPQRRRSTYRSPSMISSSAAFGGRVRSSGRLASGSSTTFSCLRKSSRSGSM